MVCGAGGIGVVVFPLWVDVLVVWLGVVREPAGSRLLTVVLCFWNCFNKSLVLVPLRLGFRSFTTGVAHENDSPIGGNLCRDYPCGSRRLRDGVRSRSLAFSPLVGAIGFL